MKYRKAFIGMASIALLTLMIASAHADDCGCPSPGLTPGFWKHNVGVYLTSEGVLTGKDAVKGAYSDPTGATEVTKDTMGDWLHALDSTYGGPLNMLALYNDLTHKGDGSYGAMLRNDAANEFNWRAGLEPGPPWA